MDHSWNYIDCISSIDALVYKCDRCKMEFSTKSDKPIEQTFACFRTMCSKNDQHFIDCDHLYLKRILDV